MEILGITVGILSLLTTILIGWQIFALIDIHKLRKNIDKKREHVIFEAERNALYTSMAMSDLYYSSLVNITEEQRVTKYILYKLYCILHASNLADFITCDATIKFLLETITGATVVRKESKKIICKALQNIQNKNLIDKYEELAEKIYNLHTA